jgi:hypothetical protein
MKVYSLVGKKLKECTPEQLLEESVGMIVDEEEEMIRLIISPKARKKQRELLMSQSGEYNKTEYAGTYLVSHLENPVIIKSFLEELKSSEKDKTTKKKAKKKLKKAKDEADQEDRASKKLLERWDPDQVKKLVNFLDGTAFASLGDIMEELDTSEGEAYWLTQDLIHDGILPGRWAGYVTDDTKEGAWVYQVITEQPLFKKEKEKKEEKEPKKEKKPKKPKKKTTKKKKESKPKKEKQSEKKATDKKKKSTKKKSKSSKSSKKTRKKKSKKKKS